LHGASVGVAREPARGWGVVGLCDGAGAEDGEVLATSKVEEVGGCEAGFVARAEDGVVEGWHASGVEVGREYCVKAVDKS